jgi:hypothetical protein
MFDTSQQKSILYAFFRRMNVVFELTKKKTPLSKRKYEKEQPGTFNLIKEDLHDRID